ncbi:MAG: hypothetical protein U1E16_02750 [Hyphomicrobiales bacterium]|uniref:hypothetical protein n=1 Tax=Aestuariivirga sp. TaxID=2650926 RepID=UPI0035B45130
MAADMDPRLIGLLRASLEFVDALRDIGVTGEIGVLLDRDGGARLTELVEVRGATNARIAGLAFEWPKAVPQRALVANDNAALAVGDESPALR